MRALRVGLIAVAASSVALAGTTPPASAAADVGCNSAGSPTVTVTCSVGTADTWTVPPGITSADFGVQGAAGSTFDQGPDGGRGGKVTATLPVNPGDTYSIEVASSGGEPSGGVPGGGLGAVDTCGAGAFCGGGGGASIISLGNPSLPANWKIVAGGGGGAGNFGAGGNAGGLTGASGGGGGGGAGGDQTGATGSGQHLTGGNGGDNEGGGGAGFYGGAAGTGGGGGGSSLVPTGGTFQLATNLSNGTVTITYVIQRTLTVTTSGFGSGWVTGTDNANTVIDCQTGSAVHTDCAGTVALGDTITLTTHAAAGSGFTGFTGAGCGLSSPCDVTMNTDKSVDAEFEPTSGARLIGQAPPLAGTPASCGNSDFEAVFGSVTSGPSYNVPGPGVITKWRTFGDPGDAGKQMRLRVYNVQDPDMTALFESQPETLAAGLNEFNTRFSVSGGERIGVRQGSGVQCLYDTADGGDTLGSRSPSEALGVSSPYSAQQNVRLDIAAVIEPDADGDGYGDASQDQCPTDATTQGQCKAPPQVDTTPPTPDFSKTPKKKTKSHTAIFGFGSDDQTATFKCAIDKKPLVACSSPKKFKKLKPRKHKFTLQAIDPAGNVSTPDVFHWRVLG